MHKSKRFIIRLISFILVTIMVIPALTAPASAAITLSKELTVYMVPNTHLDTAWQFPYPMVANHSTYGIRPMFTNSTNALVQGTQYRFTTSASAHLRMLKDYYNDDNPTAARRLWTVTKSLVDSGQLDLAGGQIVEPDLNIPSGEALTRQSLYAQHFFLNNFTLHGEPYKARTGMVPDVFGFSGQIPQILFKSEMKYFVTSKVNWNGQSTGSSDSGTAIGSSYENFRSGSRDRDSDIMNWLALDGKSVVLANFLRNDYNNTSVGTGTGNNSAQGLLNANNVDGTNFHGGNRNTGIRTALLFYGGGDFGQGMTGGIVTTNNGNSFGFHTYAATVAGYSSINVKSATVTEFFDETVANEDLSRLNTTNGNFIDGEMYAEFHRGTYSTWARLKKYNRDNELLGESAEKAATIGFYTNSISTNSQDRIEEGWYKILINQMHDVLPGSALAWQSYLTFNQQELAANLFNNVRDNALAALASRADTNTAGKPVFVYNSLSWERDGEVTVSLKYDTLPAGNVVVYDGDTPIYPSNIYRNEDKSRLIVTFVAAGVPATGYKVFDVRVEEPGARTTPLKVDAANFCFENNYLQMKMNPNSGYISSLKTKVNGEWREMFAQDVGTEGGELQIYRDCDTVAPSQGFHQWDVNIDELNKEPDFIIDDAPKSMDIVCNTPEKVTVRVVKEWNGSEVTQEFSMFADSDRVHVNLVADWYQPKRLLKVSFPIAADNGYASYETSFGTVQRPTNRDNLFGRARFEVPVHKWADVTDKSGEFGVSIMNDAKYGNDSWRKVMSNGTVFVRNRITVCRVPVATQWVSGGTTYLPQAPYTIDSSTHEINYSIYPHAGGWEGAQTVNKAYELNTVMPAFEAVKSAGDGWGASRSFAEVSKPNVVITALKNQYDAPGDNNTLVVRVYESSGKNTGDVTLTLPGNIISAKEVNMLEHDFDAAHGYTGYAVKSLAVSGNAVTFDIGKFEVLTLEVKLTPSALPALALSQESVALAFNSRGVTGNPDRRAGFLEGAGSGTSNAGRSWPAEYWPGDNKINYQGIIFNVGPAAANNFLNGTAASHTVNVTTANKYSKVYIVGAAVSTSGGTVSNGIPWQNLEVDGKFTVNYTDGTSTEKTITINGWRTHLSGWSNTLWTDDKPYVYDSIALSTNHHHTSTGTSNSDEIFECESYLFVYDIGIDATKTVQSIDIPETANIKIAAITLADPAAGFGKTFDPADATGAVAMAPTPLQVQNVKAKYAPGTDYTDFLVTWDKEENATKYRIHYGTTPGFTPSTSNQLAETPALSYVHAGPSLTAAQVSAGTTKIYYKVVAVGKSMNAAPASDASNGLATRYVNVSQGLTAATRVVANHEANTSSERARDAVDGSLSTKWCATRGGTTGSISASNPAWLALDLTGTAGQTVKIARIAVYHCGAGGEQASANTRDYNIKVSNDTTDCMTTTATSPNGTWTTIANVANNPGNANGNVTTHSITPVDARFIRLYITYPEVTAWSGAARIYEFQVFSLNPDFEEVDDPTDPVTVSSVRNARIVPTPVLDSNGRFSQANLAVEYDFYNEDEKVTEVGTVFKWNMQLQDNYRTYTVTAPEVSNNLDLTAGLVAGSNVYGCAITVGDSNGNQGQTVNVTTNISTLSALRLYDGAASLTFTASRGRTVSARSSFFTSPVRTGGISVFVAAYNPAGAMLSIKQALASFDGDGLLDCTIADFAVPSNAASVKAFYWDEDTMVPISVEALAR